MNTSIFVAGQDSLTPAPLADPTPQEQKQMLDERLFPLIQTMQPELAGKITGMLLEIDNTELLHMLESRESLKAKVSDHFISIFQEIHITCLCFQVEEVNAILQDLRAKQTATNSAST